MAIDDYDGEPVLSGTWMYDGRVPRRITIIARSYDQKYALYEAEEWLEEGEEPVPLGAGGRLYYVSESPALRSLEEAKEWVAKQPWAPVEWDDS